MLFDLCNALEGLRNGDTAWISRPFVKGRVSVTPELHCAMFRGGNYVKLSGGIGKISVFVSCSIGTTVGSIWRSRPAT